MLTAVEVTGTTYRWVIGILVGLLLTIAGAVGGAVHTASSVAADLVSHESRQAHPVSEARWQDTRRRLDRMEQKQDQILEILRRP